MNVQEIVKSAETMIPDLEIKGYDKPSGNIAQKLPIRWLSC